MNHTGADKPVIFPREVRTGRLVLRPWQGDDAEALLPVLEANREHLGPWIPRRVSDPAPVPVLSQRLTGFGDDFAANREWRFGMFSPDQRRVMGEVGLFPRAASGRVPFADADRVELGYWLRADDTGNGFVIEAARAVLAEAATVARFSHVEIRCDARNAPSVAVARRLGFLLAETLREEAEPDVELQVWTSALEPFHGQSR
jgi:RimJ/RimL family protein N-acetyltransferase